MTSAQDKIWFVTGASAGLGYSMLVYLLEKGNKVVATMRNPNAIPELVQKYSSDQLLVLKLDVVSASEIKAAFAQAVDKFGRIDIVYSNAGYATIGELESTSEEDARGQFDVNFWGSVNVARAAFDVFRDVNKPQGGRFLQVSSMSAIVPAIGLAFYSSTKAAIDNLLQAWSNELHPSWNIKITLLELGLFRTRAMGTNGTKHVHIHPAYRVADAPTAGIREFFASGGAASMGANPDKASREIYKISVDDTVPLRIPIGSDALKGIAGQLESVKEAVDVAQKWSVDLGFDA